MAKTAFTKHVSCFGLSDRGLVREQNQDAWKALPQQGLFLLADGMGGHQGGAVAAREAVALFARECDRIESEGLLPIFMRVNKAIYDKAAQDEKLTGMGTTLCCLYLHAGEAVVGHVGDSRVYLLRGEKLARLTTDHSLVSELEALGAMEAGDAAAFPYKHILTRAMGTHPKVDADVQTLDTHPGDLFLLCSDGLTNLVSDEEIRSILSEEKVLERAAFCLVDLAKKEGGIDNITVLLVKVPTDDLPR